MSAVIQQQMNVAGMSRGAAVNSPGEAAAELWKRLRGSSAAILLRARVEACAYADVLYGDEK